jgi:hypothetical protein
VDADRFDAIARAVAASGSRRRLLVGALAGVLGIAGRGHAEAVVCRTPGQLCRENANCCSRLCGKDATGRRVCRCQSAADCPTPRGGCQQATCEAGVCLTGPVVCTAPGDACVNGGCTCTVGGVCGSFQPCANSNCICGTATEGGPVCLVENAVCEILPACSSSAECAQGSVCVANTCCTTPQVCIPLCPAAGSTAQEVVAGPTPWRRA